MKVVCLKTPAPLSVFHTETPIGHDCFLKMLILLLFLVGYIRVYEEVLFVHQVEREKVESILHSYAQESLQISQTPVYKDNPEIFLRRGKQFYGNL